MKYGKTIQTVAETIYIKYAAIQPSNCLDVDYFGKGKTSRLKTNKTPVETFLPVPSQSKCETFASCHWRGWQPNEEVTTLPQRRRSHCHTGSCAQASTVLVPLALTSHCTRHLARLSSAHIPQMLIPGKEAFCLLVPSNFLLIYACRPGV